MESLTLFFFPLNIFRLTTMHSSRMRTVRSSGRISGGGGRGCTWSGGCLLWGRGVYLVPGGDLVQGVYLVPGGCLLRGGTWPGGVYLDPGGSAPRGVSAPSEVSAPGGCLLLGGCTWSGTPPCGQTDACKNITFATSLWTVKMPVLMFVLAHIFSIHKCMDFYFT